MDSYEGLSQGAIYTHFDKVPLLSVGLFIHPDEVHSFWGIYPLHRDLSIIVLF